MSRYFARLAAVALVGTMLATAPGFAAPPAGGPGGMAPGGSGAPNCTDPNSKDPACLKMHHRRGTGPQGGQTNGPPANGPTTNSNTSTMHNNMTGNGPTPAHRGPPGPPPHNGPPGGPVGHHPPFHTWMRGFHFPFFARPFFAVRPGIVVPHSYRLRRVPPEILWYYPQYAGFLYFVWRGEIVIVSPRSLRIVAILD